MSSSEDEETFQSSSSELENSKTYRIGQIKGDNTTLKELKSKEHYEAIYQLFKNWRETNVLLTNEKTLLMYFEILGEKYKPTSLWSQYSMLKRTINIHENIDITGYNSILSFLKEKAQGYQCKKSTAFKVHEIENFIANAPDELYLASKVVLIIGVAGTCKPEELRNLKSRNIDWSGQSLVITINDKKLKRERKFTIIAKYSTIVKKYRRLRPNKTETDRFFLNYQKGKCTVQVIGKNKFSIIPRQIATYLKLASPNLYTANAFRRTAIALEYEIGRNIFNVPTNRDNGNDNYDYNDGDNFNDNFNDNSDGNYGGNSNVNECGTDGGNRNEKRNRNQIENENENRNQFENENRNRNEYESENENRNQIENENQNRNQFENENENRNQFQNENENRNQIENENENRNEYESETGNENKNYSSYSNETVVQHFKEEIKEEFIIPCQNDDYEEIAMKRPKLEIEFKVKEEINTYENL